jgi:hypothetical protein
MTIDGTAGVTFPDATAQATAPTQIGVGQTWRSYTSPTRAAGGTYTNSGTKPIMVSVVVDFNNDSTGSGARNSTANLTVGGVIVAQSAGSVGTSQNFFDIPLTLCAIVPPLATYIVNLNLQGLTNSVYIVSWAELS